MKANDGTGDIPDRDEWETPYNLFRKIDSQYNFKFDCCASKDNSKADFYSNDFEGVENVYNIAWMNPPFSKARKMFNHFFKVVKQGVAIYRCDNLETKLWQEVIIPKCSWIFILKGRVNYEGLGGNGARFPSALIGYNVEPPKNLDGHLLKKVDVKA